MGTVRPNTFSKLIKNFYTQNRRSFPWRDTSNPYAILVSEIMLQQTQTHRVVPKYLNWLDAFPNVNTLAKATLAEVLSAWSGLGYNRRGKYLWESAKQINQQFKGKVPETYKELRALPGVGEYTANAILAFAFNQPTIVLETNIRTALLHHFFSDSEQKVSDTQLKEVLSKVVDKKDPRNWYYALMDYGAWLKSEGYDYFHKQKQHTKQKSFKGSERFVRGYLLREALKFDELKIKEITLPGFSQEQIQKVADDLVQEDLLTKPKPGIIRVV
jgi:A/G-specific adenine glycosylase